MIMIARIYEKVVCYVASLQGFDRAGKHRYLSCVYQLND